MVTKRSPHRALPQLAFPYGCVEAYAASLQVLKNDEGVLVAIVNNLSRYTTQRQSWSRSQPFKY